jgi:uncharacterized metal-binding protein YceD (DUF177 family)
MLESAKAITDTSHVKYPPPDTPVTDQELQGWYVRSTEEKGRMLEFKAFDLARLVATVRALQRDITEARAKLVEAQQVAENHHPLMHAVIDNWTMCKQCGRPVDYALNGKLQDVCYEHREEKE